MNNELGENAEFEDNYSNSIEKNDNLKNTLNTGSDISNINIDNITNNISI